MRIFGNANYQFLEKRRIAYLASGAALTLGVLAMIFNVFTLGSWQNYGVDFTGGVLVQVRFDAAVDVGEVRNALGGAQAPPITRFGEDNEYVIRQSLQDDVEVETIAASLQLQLDEAAGLPPFEVVRTESVGPKIGAELQQKAGLAILFSFLLTLIYIAFRFETRFGLAAVIATFHDVLFTLGVLALFRVEISLPTVAALLTIVGYSLNDTIVVFDRIRENLNRKGGRKEEPMSLMDRSINETLPRTVLTSGTTLAVLFALLIVGGAVIRDFTLVLIMGILVGTYSSIFVASPALLEIQKRWARKEAQAARAKRAPATV